MTDGPAGALYGVFLVAGAYTVREWEEALEQVGPDSPIADALLAMRLMRTTLNTIRLERAS